MPLYQVEVTEKKLSRYVITADSPEDAKAKYDASKTNPVGGFGTQAVPSGLLVLNVSIDVQQVSG